MRIASCSVDLVAVLHDVFSNDNDDLTVKTGTTQRQATITMNVDFLVDLIDLTKTRQQRKQR